MINFADQGLTSKMLATIITDVKIDFEEEKLIMCDVDKDKIRAIFTELEFLNLNRRILGEEITVTQAPSPIIPNKNQSPNSSQLDLFGTQSLVEDHEAVLTASYKTIVTERPSYHLISTAAERKELLEILLAQKQVCFDTETTNIDARQADLVGISFSYKAREAFYVAIPQEYDDAKSIIHEFIPFFQNTGIEKIAHNIKYDLKVLSRYGISLATPTFDTMIAHYLINPEARQNMDFLAQHYLNYQAISIETLIGKRKIAGEYARFRTFRNFRLCL